MKHYLNKIKLAGAYSKNIAGSSAGAGGGGGGGGGAAEGIGGVARPSDASAAKGPIYRPPRLGDMQYGASFSFLETLDLISDGPIEGVVNQEGRLVNDDGDLLQGI